MRTITLEVPDAAAETYDGAEGRVRAEARMAFLRALGPEAITAELARTEDLIARHQAATGVTDEDWDALHREILAGT